MPPCYLRLRDAKNNYQFQSHNTIFSIVVTRLVKYGEDSLVWRIFTQTTLLLLLLYCTGLVTMGWRTLLPSRPVQYCVSSTEWSFLLVNSYISHDKLAVGDLRNNTLCNRFIFGDLLTNTSCNKLIIQ